MARRPTRLTREQQRIIRALMLKHEPMIRDAFDVVVRNARGALDFDALVLAIQANDFGRIAQLLSLKREQLWVIEEATRSAMIAGGASVALPRGVTGAFSFNGRHPRAERIIAEAGARLVSEIGSPGPEVIRSILLQGQKEGIGAQAVARRLAGTMNPRTGIREGGIVGLDGPRAQRSARVREILSDPERIKDYFRGSKPRFTGTDRRFDAKVRKAIAEGKALPKADIERIAKLHDARLLKARGETIARDQAFTAQAEGRAEAWRQVSERDDVESVEKLWQHATSKNPRHNHQALDGKRVPLNEGFPLGDGTTIQYAHDPDAPAEEKLGCRCSTVFIPKFKRG